MLKLDIQEQSDLIYRFSHDLKDETKCNLFLTSLLSKINGLD